MGEIQAFQRIGATDAAIDKRVYELYGLTEEELTGPPDCAKAPARVLPVPLFFHGRPEEIFFLIPHHD